jgi:hypothetical protein
MGFPSGGSAALSTNTRVCLGLVLPVSIPSNYTAADAYFGADGTGAVPPTACSVDPVTGSVVMASSILDSVFSATTLCPDGKTQPCRVPVNNSTGTNNFNCYVDHLNATILPLRDNRGYNLHPLTSAGKYKRDTYSNPNIPLSGGIPASRQNRVATAFYRLHFALSSQPGWTTNKNNSVPTLKTNEFCEQLTDTTQIGCLVKANACSIGFAGREGVDALASLGENMAFRVNDIQPSVTNIENLFTGGSPVYPLARGLYVNSVKGFANVTAGPELTLLNFMMTPASIDPIIIAHNFIQVPAGVTRQSGCPR